MKLLIALVLTITYVLLILVEDIDAADSEKLLGWIKSCQEQAGASNEDYEKIVKRKIPTTNEGICMVECIFTKLHIIENGSFNHKGFVVAFSPTAKGDLKKLSQLRELAATCKKESQSTDESIEGCSNTKALLDCFAKNMDKIAK